MRLERQIYLGRLATKETPQGSSGHASKHPLPPTSAGHQNSATRTMRSMADESDDDDFDTRTVDAPEGWSATAQPAKGSTSSSNNESFLSRLRTQSFPGISASIRHKGGLFLRKSTVDQQSETAPSSDSSSGEEQAPRPPYHPSALRNRRDVRQIFVDTQGGAGDSSDGDQEDEDLE
jgi:hypothetical protein